MKPFVKRRAGLSTMKALLGLVTPHGRRAKQPHPIPPQCKTWHRGLSGWLRCLSTVPLVLCSFLASAQELGKSVNNYTYAPGSPEYWRGLHSQSVFRRDPHVWVITPELAKKGGLPLEWASTELQGVAGAAWHIQPGEERCGWGGDPEACKREMQCTLDLYVDRQTQVLPWNRNQPLVGMDWRGLASARHALAPASLLKPDELSPFADPKTAERLKWFWAEADPQFAPLLIAYDREIHARYVYLRFILNCNGELGTEPHKARTLYLGTPAAHKAHMTPSSDPSLHSEAVVHYTMRFPASWDQRIGLLRKPLMERAAQLLQPPSAKPVKK